MSVYVPPDRQARSARRDRPVPRPTQRKAREVMTTHTDDRTTPTGSPHAASAAVPAAEVGSDVEGAIQELLSRKRQDLAQELGLAGEGEVRHFRKPEEHLFTKNQRPHTTILLGGLTWKHERLVQGVLEGLGYRCEQIATPDTRAFQLGKEFGNNGQCNPTYFTVGNLVQHLQGLESKGLTRERIKSDYVFLTAGACGPCRFGMYEAEYRLALRNSGFDGFRVLLFQQSGQISQSGVEAGLEMNAELFLPAINASSMGDQLNDIAYQIRPFEVSEGETDRVLEESIAHLHGFVRDRACYRLDGRLGRVLTRVPALHSTVDILGKFLQQMRNKDSKEELRQIARRFGEIEVDRTRVKPVVKITGEFWAQTTEGDGNFNMFAFLQREGAQVRVEPVGTWFTYIIHQAKQKMLDSLGLPKAGDEHIPGWRLGRRLRRGVKQRRPIVILTVVESVLRHVWDGLRGALGNIPHELTDQYQLQRLGHPFYNSRAGGGEGYMEVAKNIYYHNKSLAHMVLGLKPFGCMPSTQSDGAQSALNDSFKDIIYLPIETSGEGEINAHSRVHMALGEAKAKCKEEFERVLEATGYSLGDIRAYVEAHPELKSAMYPVPHAEGITGTAANFVHHVAARMERQPAASTVRPAAPAAAERRMDAAKPADNGLEQLNRELVLVED